MRDGHVKDAAQDVAEDVTQGMVEDVSGAAKDGSDLAQDLSVNVLGAAKNRSVKLLIVKAFILSTVKARAGHVYHPPGYPSLPGNAKRLYVYPHPCPSGGPSRRA